MLRALLLSIYLFIILFVCFGCFFSLERGFLFCSFSVASFLLSFLSFLRSSFCCGFGEDCVFLRFRYVNGTNCGTDIGARPGRVRRVMRTREKKRKEVSRYIQLDNKKTRGRKWLTYDTIPHSPSRNAGSWNNLDLFSYYEQRESPPRAKALLVSFEPRGYPGDKKLGDTSLFGFLLN